MILLTTVLSGCQHAQINDHEICADKGSFGASCVHTISTTPVVRLNPAQWADKRFGWLCESSQSFADDKKAIEQLCQRTGLCDFKNSKSIQNFLSRVEDIQR